MGLDSYFMTTVAVYLRETDFALVILLVVYIAFKSFASLLFLDLTINILLVYHFSVTLVKF